MPCLFCQSEDIAFNIEHIIPESLGNKDYVLPKGTICTRCNNKFSRYEKEALSNTIIGLERTRLAIQTKKGKIPSAKVGDIEFRGDTQGRKNIIKLTGIKEEEILSADPQSGTFKVLVPGFDKNDVLIGKFMLKVGFEAIYKSMRGVFKRHGFSELMDYINGTNNIDWPYIVYQKEFGVFKSIPRFYDKYLLNKISCKLLYREGDDGSIIFRFIYGGFMANINLSNRETGWIREYIKNENDLEIIHPAHFKRDFAIRIQDL